ncbi:MAG: cytochrome c oxidase subunit II [Proteobacteria bacterium]|nr:cytochrome c oxidase subunit II [Pseudomonadota bacterium]
MHKILKTLFTLILFFFSPLVLAEMALNMPRGVTPISKDIYDLHMVIFWICVAIGVGVFSVMIYSLMYHRKSKGAVPAAFHEHMSLEILWAVIPFVILVVMAIPATKVLIDMHDTDDAAVTIKIVGHQWKWEYQYLDQGVQFYSNLSTPFDQIHNNVKKDPHYLLQVDNPVVVPVHKKVRFLVTSADVVHSWWVPELGIKRDAIPGFIHEAWARVQKPGTYRGQCAELCGVNHGFMPIVVQAVSDDEFNQWVAAQMKQAKQAAEASQKPLTREELMTMGKKVYENNCAACHKVDGQGMPPVFPPMRGSSVAVGHPVSRHISLVLHGVPNTAMQAFASQLSDLELAAVITYERNAWGNNTGELVQPKDVQDLRAVKKLTRKTNERRNSSNS